MRLLLHTALLATVAIAAPVAQSKSDSDVNGGRGAYNEWDGSSKDLDTNGGRGTYNEWDGSAKDLDTNEGRGGYNEWDGTSKRSLYADFGRRWHHGRDSQRGSCDLRNAVMPAGKSRHPQQALPKTSPLTNHQPQSPSHPQQQA